jgi:glycosyltransferase involved in cell wall biosynthesis
MTNMQIDQGAAVFLVSPSETPCGVETFARHLARSWGAAGHDATQIPVCGGSGEIAKVWRALTSAETLVINAPVVAWKRVLLVPLLCLCLARLRGRKVVHVLHEWRDLDPRRRLVLSIYLLFATHVLYSSPSVREQHRRNFLARWLPFKTGLVPIPPNIAPPSRDAESRMTPPRHHAVRQLAAARAAGRLVIGHFGSIYPRKCSDRILEVAAELKRRGHNVLLAYIGDFIRGSEDIEAMFARRIAKLDLQRDVLITGYIQSHDDVYAALRETDVLVYAFAEGLTSRRGSVLAALLSGRPVIVNRPENEFEFDHHPAFRQALATEALRFVDAADDIAAYADAIEAAHRARQSTLTIDFDTCWRDATAAFRRVLRDEPIFDVSRASVPAE